MTPEPLARPRGAAALTRLSFRDGAGVAGVLAGLGWWTDGRPADDAAATVIAALGRTADPDSALRALADLVAGRCGADITRALVTDSTLRARLLPLLAISAPLADHLRRHPESWHALLDPASPDDGPGRLLDAVGADASDPATGTAGRHASVTGRAAVAALQAAYRRELVAIAGRDLAGELGIEEVTGRLADVAGELLQAALSVAAATLPANAAPCRLAVIAMGKAGGRELNYVSDVDVVFVGEPVADTPVDAALATAARLAGETMRLCRAVAWEVDAALRPEGKAGPLVRTLASHEAYYRRWASTWEFQALLKARPIAGDLALGAAYQQALAPMIWTAAERHGFVEDVRAMRRRVVEHIPAALADREIKLGRGGLRDVEFAVQLLQLVHGRGDESLRVAGTLPALAALRDGGYVGRADATSLTDAYVFLRTTEHRLQLRRLRRASVVPEDPDSLRELARAMGYRPDARGDAATVWAAEWALHAREVRRLHERLFYRPLLEAVARVPSEALRLTPEQARQRLAALGFASPERALQQIEALTAGLSRRAVLQRALLPVLLSEFADAPDPDGGLLAYRSISEQLGGTPWYLRLLRDEGKVAPRLAHILGTSRYVARMLGRAPEALRMLSDDAELVPRPGAEVLVTMRETADRHADPVSAVAAVRGIRRQELLRTAFADLLGLAGVTSVCQAISATTRSTLEAALQVALRDVAAARNLPELPVRFAVIAMGRLGGDEAGYGSDADVLFVFEPVGDSVPGDDESTGGAALAHDVATRLRALLAAPSSVDPPLVVDAALRPEGRSGALVRSLGSYARYYERWSSPWEAQALLRARFAAGDEELGHRFEAMIAPLRYPAGGLSREQLLDIRRVKGRVDAERLPRGADPSTHTKLGRGGLADVEWTVQLLQLQHAGRLAALQTPRTLEAIDAAAAHGLLTVEQAEALGTAWRLATRLRNAIMLVRDKAADQIPHQSSDRGVALHSVARALGEPAAADPGKVIDDWRRAARRARRVVEDVFYETP